MCMFLNFFFFKEKTHIQKLHITQASLQGRAEFRVCVCVCVSSDCKEMHVVQESWWSGDGFLPTGHACFGHRIEGKWFVFLGFYSVHLIRQGTHAPPDQMACFQGQHLVAENAAILRRGKSGRWFHSSMNLTTHLLSTRWIQKHTQKHLHMEKISSIWQC